MTFDTEDSKKAISMASRMADDFDAKRVEAFAETHTGESWYEDFVLLYRMISHPEYSLSGATWCAIAGALAYVVCPIDVIPDFIPIIGWIDDAFVLSFVIASLKSEIQNFERFLHQI